MELITYDPDSVPAVFGLVNTGVLCYLNSLIQALASCSAFNQYLLENRFKYKDNKIVQEYIDLLGSPDAVKNGSALLKELIIARKRKGMFYNLSFGEQEDCSEGLVLLLESIGGGIERLFHNRYKCKLICKNCGKVTRPGDGQFDEPAEIIIDLSEYTLETKAELEEFIKKNAQVPQDYKCEGCGVANKPGQVQVHQVYSLVRISEIIVLLFKKYHFKHQVYFPPRLEFQGKKGLMRYQLVAQVEHFGTMGGGHYVARGLRWENNKRYSERKERAQQVLSALRDDDKKEKIKQYLAENEKVKSVPRVYEFNDSSHTPAQFSPTPSTYLVFYHLQSH